ncbi:MAG: DNA-directed polymerase subunit omega [Verrucomicrobiota bacterium]
MQVTSRTRGKGSQVWIRGAAVNKEGGSGRLRSLFAPWHANKSVDNGTHHSHSQNSFFMATLVPRITPVGLTATEPTIVQFPTEATSPVRSLRNMTTQLLQEAAQVIPNQQLLINVVSKRVRQLGLGHRPMVETGPRASLTDIALKEIIAGKLTYESLKDSADAA